LFDTTLLDAADAPVQPTANAVATDTINRTVGMLDDLNRLMKSQDGTSRDEVYSSSQQVIVDEHNTDETAGEECDFSR
jgi:hypothetical protein